MKNFFKSTSAKVLITLSILTILCTSAMYITKPKKQESFSEFLYNAGFKNVPSFANMPLTKERSEWNAKGIRYISYDEMNQLLDSNSFILAPAERYAEEIPLEKQREIKMRYEQLEDDMLSYIVRAERPRIYGNGTFYVSRNEISYCFNTCNDSDWHLDNPEMLINAGIETTDCSHIGITPNSEHKTIFVVAHPSKFLPGTTDDRGKIEAKPLPDPIAVLKHRTGYLVLASW